MESCPCGSKKTYSECCEPYIKGVSNAPTAETLLRSRYSAYVKTEVEYILSTTHPDRRKECDENAIRKWSANSEWHSLEILGTTKGGAQDSDGKVEFIATFTEDRIKKSLSEKAEFLKMDGQWFYTDGEIQPTKPFVRESAKTNRNDPCPCGSGKKFKKCCA